jgi:hypothetical protein
MYPCQIADVLAGFHRQFIATYNLPVDPDPIVDVRGVQIRNAIRRQTGLIYQYLYEECGSIRLVDVVKELVSLGAYGVLQDRKWLWDTAKECSPECRAYADQCYREQLACTVAELPRLV